MLREETGRGLGSVVNHKRGLASVMPSGYAVEVQHHLDAPGWDTFVEKHEFGRHVQATSWARFQLTRGWAPVRVVVREGAVIVAAAQMLVRRMPLVGAVAYLDHGPLVVEHQPELLDVMVDAIRCCVHDEAIHVLVVQPATEATGDALVCAGFAPTDLGISSLATIQVDLAASEDELLQRMNRTTRQNVRRGMRSGLVIREGGEDDLAIFHTLLEATAERQHFTPNCLQYFIDLSHEIGRSGECQMFLAEDGSQPIAGLVLVTFGNRAVCKRAAWSGTAGELRPNEALHWSAMRWAKGRGIRFYDFDGVDADVARAVCAGGHVPRSAVDSVSRFKLGFGGDVVFRPPALWYIPGTFGGAAEHMFEALVHTASGRRLLRRLQTA